MSYVSSLNSTQIANAKLIADTAVSMGIKNGNTIAALLAIASKESELIPHDENMNYTAKRIMEVWKKTPPDVAAKLANNPVGLANYMYGGKYGNGPTEGFLYRGRGFNQITFKNRYKQIGDFLKINLVANPDLLDNPATAAKAFVAYYLIELKRNKIDPNGFKSKQIAIDTIYQANAGKIGKPISDTTGGYAKAASRYDDLIKLVSEHKTAAGSGVFFLILVGVAVWKRKEIATIAQKLINKK